MRHYRIKKDGFIAGFPPVIDVLILKRGEWIDEHGTIPTKAVLPLECKQTVLAVAVVEYGADVFGLHDNTHKLKLYGMDIDFDGFCVEVRA